MKKRVEAGTEWRCLEPFLNRSRSQYPIYSVSELQQLIRYERARSDREGSAFSVAVFDIGHGNGNGNGGAHSAEALVSGLRRVVRETDHLGWYGCRGIGVILPGATEKQAKMFMGKVQQRMPEYLHPASMRVFSYQDGRLKRRLQASGNRNPKGGKAGATLDPFCPLHKDAEWSSIEPLQDQLAQKMPPWKRILDITVSVAALLALAPVFLVVGIYIELVSPGPIIFKQKRVGYRARLFNFYKFRTMKIGNDQQFHSAHAEDFIKKGNIPMTKLDEKDSRIIRGGKILRKAALDELPQFFCVLNGDMSIVGPRPCIVYEAKEYLRWHRSRFDVLPGITGLWQVNGKSDLTFREMICLDSSYARHMSPLLDLKLIAATIPAIVGYLRKAIRRKLKRT